MAEAAGANVGVVFDTGNPFAVGEDPVAFARRAAHRIRHVHLKDYRAQFTDEGYRLVRCAIGDGAVPFGEISAVLSATGPALTASIEPGALEAGTSASSHPTGGSGYRRARPPSSPQRSADCARRGSQTTSRSDALGVRGLATSHRRRTNCPRFAAAPQTCGPRRLEHEA